MARTTRSTGLQNTVGPVPTATLPTDPVPLSQSGVSNVIWGHAHGRAAEVTVSRKLGFYWDAGVYDGEPPLAMPFEMRLKGVGWYPYGKNWDLNVIRNTTVVATVGANSYTDLDILFQPVLNGWFQTSSFVRLAFNWNLMTYWEIVSKSGIGMQQPAADPELAAGRGPTAGIMSRLHTQENQDVPEIAASPKKGFAERIKRLFR